jgi:integrase
LPLGSGLSWGEVLATKRLRGDRWEYCIRRKGLLKKPFWTSFNSEEEGDAWCARIERLLDSGVVPEEIEGKTKSLTTVSLAYEYYVKTEPVSETDKGYWPAILNLYGETRVSAIDYAWVERMIDYLKRDKKRSPSTIRHYAGTMSRMWDWLLKRQNVPTNPFKSLRRGYASGEREDVSRDRRVFRDEEVRFIAVMDGDILLLFLLALETAMRMREMYTLTDDQIDLSQKTIFLDKTKNGSKRQVPLSSVALELLKDRPKGWLFPDLYCGEGTLANATNRISKRFTYYANMLCLEDLNFHDTRHEATCRLYERTTLSDIQIAKITGHRDPRMLMRYANLRASDLAARLW